GHNNTTATKDSISLSLGENQTFNVNYSFSSTPTQVYNATYNISTVEDSREPFKLLNVSLKPAVPPNISIDLQPAIADQNESITIIANVTSGTEFSIAAAR
ncbi:MAG: hypothetical protein SVU32_09780, partial [Candidatus Nanohaloarchaea archaeon]|nr:hypothetical protein [Candidatus Nanohaloarchaea archaeon]